MVYQTSPNPKHQLGTVRSQQHCVSKLSTIGTKSQEAS